MSVFSTTETLNCPCCRGPVVTPCCAEALPRTLHATVVLTGDCAGLIPSPITIVYDPGTATWTGTVSTGLPFECASFTVVFFCDELTGLLSARIVWGDNGGPDGFGIVTFAQCDPLLVTVTRGTTSNGPCCTGTVTVTITL